MKTVLKIVFRNLRANVRRTLETLFGVSLASFLAVLACSLVGVMEDVAGKHLFTEAVFIALASSQMRRISSRLAWGFR